MANGYMSLANIEVTERELRTPVFARHHFSSIGSLNGVEPLSSSFYIFVCERRVTFC